MKIDTWYDAPKKVGIKRFLYSIASDLSLEFKISTTVHDGSREKIYYSFEGKKEDIEEAMERVKAAVTAYNGPINDGA